MGSVHRSDWEAGNRQRDPQRPGAGDERADGDVSRRPPKTDPRRDERTPIPAVGGTGTVERPSDISRVRVFSFLELENQKSRLYGPRPHRAPRWPSSSGSMWSSSSESASSSSVLDFCCSPFYTICTSRRLLENSLVDIIYSILLQA